MSEGPNGGMTSAPGAGCGQHEDRRGDRVVRMVPRNPFSAQLAIHAVAQQWIGAALLDDEQPLLESASESLSAGMSIVSAQLIELAQTETQLSDRQKAILHLLSSGLDHYSIARRLFISRSTLKRELRVLRGVVGCSESGQSSTISLGPELEC